MHLIDEKGEIWRHFNVTAQNTYVVLDADGVVSARATWTTMRSLTRWRARGLRC